MSEKRGVRALHLGGPAIQSAIRLSRPDELELHYTQAMMAFLLFEPAPRDLVMVGLGGGSIARFVNARIPEARMTAVEINPRVLAAARSLFGLPTECERLAVELEDGAKWIPAHRECADVLLLDAFEDGKSVKALATQAFYCACRDALRHRGILVVNFIAEERHFGKYLARIEEVFGGKVLCLPAQDRVNMIVLAFKGGPARIAVDTLKKSARALKRRYGLPFDRFVTDLLELNSRTTAYLRIGRP